MGVGPYIPEDLLQDERPFATLPQVGDLRGGVISAESSFLGGTTNNLIQSARGAIDEREDKPGDWLTHDEWENSPLFRKQLSKGFANGVDSNVAQMAADRLDGELERQDQLNRMGPGFLSMVSRGVGSVIGWSLDPINAATVAATTLSPEVALPIEALIGTRMGLTAEALARTGARVGFPRRLIRAGIGLGEGAAAFTPTVVSQYIADDMFGQKTTIAQSLIDLGEGAAFGGILRGAFGFGKIITPEANAMAKQTATAQLLRGKTPSVMPIIINGYKDARATEEGSTAEQVEAVKNNIQAEQTKLDTKIAKQQTATNTLREKPLATRPLQRGPDLVQKLNEVLKTSEEKRTNPQKKFLTNEHHLTEVQEAHNISNIPDEQRSPEEQEFLARFNHPVGERAIVEERLQTHQIKTTELTRQLKETAPDNVIDQAHLKTQLDASDHNVRMAQNRLNELDRNPSFSVARKNAEVKLFNLKHSRNLSQELINEHDMVLRMSQDKGTPVDLANLKLTSDIINSVEGDSVFLQSMIDNLDSQLRDIPEKPSEAFDKILENGLANMKQLEKDGKLTEAQAEEFKQSQEAPRNIKILSKGLRDMVNCMVKNEE